MNWMSVLLEAFKHFQSDRLGSKNAPATAHAQDPHRLGYEDMARNALSWVAARKVPPTAAATV